MVDMAKYKKCPRCELNYIPINEDYCEVCEVELGKAPNIKLIEEVDDEDVTLFEERICPECKVNYLEDDEEICAACRNEKLEKKLPDKALDVDEDDNWRQFVEEDEPLDEPDEIPLDLLQEEEEELEDDEEEAPYEEEDDFDEPLDDIDFDEDEDEENEKEDEDDF